VAIVIQVHNISTVLSGAQLAPILAAVEAQVGQDVAPHWGNQSVVFRQVASSQDFTPSAWRFVVADTSDQAGAAGYHETDGATPIGYAFVKTTLEAGMQPSVTISHEAIEMVGDALIDQSNQWSDLPHALFLAQELCDPVEDDSYGYMKNGVLVSDFVTPAYFVPASHGPWDFRGVLKAPNSLALGGYQLIWDPKNGWRQQIDSTATTQSSHSGSGAMAPGRISRFALRSAHSRSTRRLMKAASRTAATKLA